MKNFTFLLISLLFTIHLFSQPVIRFFSPTSGPIGTTVTIKGTGFSTTPTDNIVYFGAVKTTVSDANDTTLNVTVPVGATFQPITVTTNKLTGYSINSFIVTFPGGGASFTSASFLPKIDLAAGIYPHSICLADFNADGKTDVLVSKGSSATVTVFANSSTSGSISFAPQLDLMAAGNNHEGSATGDLDGDGKLDFVITNSNNSSSVSVFKNTSVGESISFAPKIDYPADNGAYSVAIGDVDSDGKPDLVAANNGSNIILFYKNTSTAGTISFNTRIDFTVGTNPYSIAIGDLDGDGKPDLAITTQGSSSALSVLKNTTTGGTISFDPPIDYATLAGSFIVSIGDLDGDGKPDLAAASSSSYSVTVLRNTSMPGNISFTSLQNFSTGNYPVCVALGDLDGDGKPDIVTSNRFSNNVSALKNKSTIFNINFDTHVDFTADTDPFYVAIGDLDGDGRPDILSANSASTTVSIFRNIIGANIAPTISSFTPTSGVSGITVTIIGSNFTGATSVKFGGAEAFSFTVDSATGISAIVGAGATGDVSVTTASGTATLAGFTFNGPVITSFTPTIGVTGTIVTITGSNFTGVTDVKFGGTSAASFTVNSQTTITATVGAGSGGSITVTTANGTAALTGFTFGVPTITSFAPVSGAVGSAVTITGTNFKPLPSGNIVFFGAVKAMVSSATSTRLNVIVPAGATYEPITVTTSNLTAYSSLPFIVTFPGDTTPLTTNSFSIVGNYGTGTYPISVSISDLNGDGKPDLVTANSVSNNISILKNTSTTGTISFDVKTDYSTGPDPKKIAIGDLDGDGKPDIVVTNFNAGNASTISVFRNTSAGGTISFAPKTDYSTGNGSVGIAIADMNGDGKPDIVVPSGNSGIFSIFINTTITAGSVSFSAKQDYTLFDHPDNIAIADLDKDGRPDLVTANFSGGTISIFRNTSEGGILSFGSRIDYHVGIYLTYITTGDLDGDGKLDLVVTNYTSNILFLKNFSDSGNISFASINNYTLGASNVSITDLNGDGKPDLFAGTGISGIASVIENTYPGTGNFTFATNVDFTTGNYDTHVSVDDLDGDGKPDLAVVNALLNTVSILKNKIGEPVITFISATTAKKGTTVTINGSNFSGATSVIFGGTPAVSFNVISATKIEAIIGGGASGDITVTTPLGTGTLAGFKFIPQINAGGPLNFCKGGVVNLTSSASANNQWYKDGTVISGATANTLEVNAAGTYTVSVTSNGIATSSDTGIVVTVISVPTPVISKDINNNFVSSAATGNQWYFNDDIIPGATAQTYQPKQSGSYTVKNTLNDCISDFSPSYTFALTGTIDLGNGEYINLYPNPVKNKLYINWNINSMPLLNIQVSDFQGNQVLLIENIQTPALIDLSPLPQGIYLIKIYNSQLNISNTIKIIKEN
jgi:FG-GAP-like repeat/IPT/TIG domain/Secretion system C-terminal sorting domain